MSKILITGTGRSGTSFLVHLLSALGMDTGYTEEECFNELQNPCRGGCEHTIEKPYKILKNPEFALNIENIVQNYDIEHVIIPIRKLHDVGKSRENNSENHGGYGGFWNDCQNIEEQMDADARLLYNLIEVLERYKIGFTTISFPKMTSDWKYLWGRLIQGNYMNLNIVDSYYRESEDVFSIPFNRIADIKKVTIK